MRIEIDIPDWAKERDIYVMAGIELAAYKPAKGRWHIKTGRCNMCGKCCMNFKKGQTATPWKDMVKDGRCVHLVPDGDRWMCGLGAARPWSCSVAVFKDSIKGCTEEFKEI